MILDSPHPSLAPYPEHPVDHFLARASESWPHKIAVIDGDRRRSFLALEKGATQIARVLRSRGITKGDRVMLMAQNGIEFIEACFGILKVGAVITPTNTSWKSREIQYQLEDSESKAIIFDSSFGDEIQGVESRGEERIIVDESSRAEFNVPDSSIFETPSIDTHIDLAALPYSSGTTGLPKGVMLSHSNIVTNVHQMKGVCRPIDLGRDDIYLNHLPYFHIYGFTCLMTTALSVGAVQVIMKRYEPELFLSLLAQYRPTILLTVAPVLQNLLNRADLDAHDFTSIRLCTTGAAALPTDIGRRFANITGVEARQGYGLTETSPVTNLTIPKVSSMETIGPPAADTREKVVDMDDPTKELAPGEIGELAICGPQVMIGYWRAPEANREAMIGDWFLTGDIATIERDGSIRILDRKKEMIKYKGFAIAPAEVEATLLEHPLVLDCAVIPTQHPQWGEVPKAYVVVKGEPFDFEALQAFVSERLASYKCPKLFEIIGSIPRSPAGKILRRELVAREKKI